MRFLRIMVGLLGALLLLAGGLAQAKPAATNSAQTDPSTQLPAVKALCCAPDASPAGDLELNDDEVRPPMRHLERSYFAGLAAQRRGEARRRLHAPTFSSLAYPPHLVGAVELRI